jgi:hypothetical protein
LRDAYAPWVRGRRLEQAFQDNERMLITRRHFTPRERADPPKHHQRQSTGAQSLPAAGGA